MSEEAPPLVLASSSPRRKDLLARFGLAFTVAVPEVDESPLPGETPEGHVERLALEKARAVGDGLRRGIVVAADTVVVLEGRILGKPAGPEEAVSMLRDLSGRSHGVLTGVAVADAASGAVLSAVVRSRVLMSPLSTEQIRRYVATGEPLDKAGSYAVQGEGGRFVAAVDGSLTNVIGLPLRELHELLVRAGCPAALPGGDL